MSTLPFTEAEQTDVLRFLGYQNWADMAGAIQLGYPATSQPMFLVFDAMERIRPTARAVVREHLCQLRSTESQIGTARSRMKAERVGEVAMNMSEAKQLREEYAFWQGRLADLLGVEVNHYSRPVVSGLNARVR